MPNKPSLCIVGTGYVGLPLAFAFARKGYDVTGYDIKKERIDELSANHDSTGEISEEQLKSVAIRFTTDPAAIGKSSIVILAIPTPVDEYNKPDLTLVMSATRAVGEQLKPGMIIVYESTVYPGTTEDMCGPILEEASGLTCGKDFTLGYSPERINPGDKEHTVDKIIKIVSGQDEKTTDILCELYGSIVTAGIHRVKSIKIAEMAKAIENAQRDLNVAYVNEVAVLCHAIGIPTKDVLDAAGTKWNFLKFSPGLVGGHCISVDPYYLVEKAEQLGIQTQVIDAGRSINDQMGRFVAFQVHEVFDAPKKRILVLGLTFKPNIHDTRNSKSDDVIETLMELGHTVEVHDPHVPAARIEKKGMKAGSLASGPYDAVVLLVPHREYLEGGTKPFLEATNAQGLIYDMKSVLAQREIESKGRTYRAL